MRKGFTLVEMVIVIGVLMILLGLFTMSSTETITTAHATRILNNLRVMKTAVLAWYRDNRDKVITITVSDTKNPGMVNINGIHPIQEIGDNELKLSVYLEDLGGSGINLSNKETVSYGTSSRQNTLLQPGCYGVCDGGTEEISGKKYYHRDTWYVGYRFKDNEGPVREKIRARLKSNAGMWLGTGDAHVDYNRSNEEAVWLKVLQL